MNTVNMVFGRMLRAMLRGYQLLLSPLLPGTCRYHPTCSEYAVTAIGIHGPAHGLWLAFKRICRCHPWGGYGMDPVPLAKVCEHTSSQVSPTANR